MTLRSFHLVADKIAEADYFLGRMNETSEEFDVFRFNYSAFVSAARSITSAPAATKSILIAFSRLTEWSRYPTFLSDGSAFQ